MFPKENPERRRRSGLDEGSDTSSTDAAGSSEEAGASPPEPASAGAPGSSGEGADGASGLTTPPDLASSGRSRNSFVEALALVMTALMLALTLKTYVAEAYEIKGRSMLPTFHNGERVVVLKAFYAIERGDIIIFESTEGGKDLIKRVIGLPGETVRLENGRVFIDGRPLEEGYLEGVDLESDGLYREEVLQADEYYVLGDNRGDSHDSRKFRGVPVRNIKGKVIVRWWPLGELSCF